MDVNKVIKMCDTEETLRVHLRFEGRVQGVGFRWTTMSLAQEAGVAGWVRNEDDGTVTAELQGSGHDINRVLTGLRNQYASARKKYLFLRDLQFSVAEFQRRVPRVLPDGPVFDVLN